MLKQFKLYIVYTFFFLKSLWIEKFSIGELVPNDKYLDCRFFTLKNLPYTINTCYEFELEDQHVKHIVAPVFCIVDSWVFVDTSKEKITRIINESNSDSLEELSKEFKLSFEI